MPADITRALKRRRAREVVEMRRCGVPLAELMTRMLDNVRKSVGVYEEPEPKVRLH